MRKTIELEGYKIDCVDEIGFVDLAMSMVERGTGGWVWTPNVDMFRHCKADPLLGELIHEADIVIADGMPLVWASWLQGTPLPERVAGSSTIWLVCSAAAKHNYRVFLLGGGEIDTATRTASILTEKYHGLNVVGTYYPPFGFEKDETQYQNMINAINTAQPDIIFCALSFPKGEYLTKRIRHHCHPALWMGVGISFSFITGDVKRAPIWIQKLGFEWLHRMSQEPKRMAKRYLYYDIPFGFGMLHRALTKRFRSSSQHTIEPN